MKMYEWDMKRNNACDFGFFLRRVYLVKSMCPFFTLSPETSPESRRIVYLFAKRLELGNVVWTREQTNKQTNKYFLLPHSVVTVWNQNWRGQDFLHASTWRLFVEILLMVVKGILIKMSVVDIPTVQAFLFNQMSYDTDYSLRLR